MTKKIPERSTLCEFMKKESHVCVEKREIPSHQFFSSNQLLSKTVTLTRFLPKKFRESNVSSKKVTKETIPRKKNFGEREFLVFPHCVTLLQ